MRIYELFVSLGMASHIAHTHKNTPTSTSTLNSCATNKENVAGASCVTSINIFTLVSPWLLKLVIYFISSISSAAEAAA
jgi:hypothetical protein